MDKKTSVTIAVLGAAIFLISGGPAFIVALSSHATTQVTDPFKLIGLTPAAIFMYAIGFIGLYGMTKTKAPKYPSFAPLCWTFVFGSLAGLELLYHLGMMN